MFASLFIHLFAEAMNITIEKVDLIIINFGKI